MGYTTKNIRNVVLLGHSGSGKTTLAEAMLFEAKAITRRGYVSDGTTASDYTNIEQERGNSLFSTLLHAKWKNSKINIIDTPGSDDFVGEVISSMKVADTAVMVLNACGGVEVGTEILWEYVDRFKTPALFVVNHLDNDKANFDNTLEQAKARFGNKVIPFQFPITQGVGFHRIVDCLRMVTYVFEDEGGKPKKEEIPDEHKSRAQAIHNQLVEAAAENDETLMEKFFEEGTLSESELADGLRIALANQEIFPVFIGSAHRNMGSGRVMGFINDICPSPADRPEATLQDGGILETNTAGTNTLFIYKTLSEPRVGMLSYFKVYSGKISSGTELSNNRTRTTERISQIYEANGKERSPINELVAGDIGVTVKLKETKTNDTLSPKGANLEIEQIHFPSSRIRRAVEPPGKNEMKWKK